MATKKKMLQAAAGNAGGEALNVEDVFSTYLYEGNGSTQTITNGLDLGGEGGLVWIKKRNESSNSDHMLFDTERGPNERLYANTTDRQFTRTDQLNSFDSSGFTLGGDSPASPNNSGKEYASWTFRKAPKFFDVVTYTGTGNNRQISHDLGTTVGSMFIKKTSTSGTDWAVYHKGTGNTEVGFLNETWAFVSSSSMWNNTTPTSTDFTVGSHNMVNQSGENYVAYIFAHNDGDGEFGADGDADIIKCGSYEGNDSDSTEININLGFEPQWLLIKNADLSRSWTIVDVMRGLIVGPSGSGTGTTDRSLSPNLSDSEDTASSSSVITRVDPTSTGFVIRGKSAICNEFGTHIYMAIRRGTKVPESGTEVFDTVTGSGVQSTGFPVDFLIGLNNRTNTESYDPFVKTRLLGGASYLVTSSTAAEASGSDVGFDTMDGLTYSWPNSNAVSWYWKRAPGYFDVVAYTGDSTAQRAISHNLGVAPEMIWVKNRDQSGYNWIVGMGDPVGWNYYLNLNGTSSRGFSDIYFGNTNTAPTDSQFYVGRSAGWDDTNRSTYTYIAYLFASLDGISKVGSYTGDGTTGQTIDCGFTSGARFILIKRTDTSSNWFVWDTERGIVSGNDPYLRLNRDLAEETTQDDVDPQSSGFIVNQGENNLNQSGGSYIFYAIA